jgi:hypothetical protein
MDDDTIGSDVILPIIVLITILFFIAICLKP